MAPKKDGVPPSPDSLRAWRKWYWPEMPIADEMERVQALLAQAPRVAMDFMGIHELVDMRKRIERVVSVCALALKDNPRLAPRMRSIVPALAREKVYRSMWRSLFCHGCFRQRKS